MVQLTTSPGLALMPIEAPLAVVVAPPTTVQDQPLGRNAPPPTSAPSVSVYEPAARLPNVWNVPAVVKLLVPSSLTLTEPELTPVRLTGHEPACPLASLSTLITAGAGALVMVQVTVSSAARGNSSLGSSMMVVTSSPVAAVPLSFTQTMLTRSQRTPRSPASGSHTL